MEEEASNVVVPLPPKSNDHHEEQKQFRAESCRGVGKALPAVIENAYKNCWFPVRCGYDDTANHESYVDQPYAYGGRKNPFVCIPYGIYPEDHK